METIETFSDWLKRQNFDEPLKPKIITDDDKDLIRRELKTKTVMQICKEHKYSHSTVYTIARER
jgi:hypothetical protein